MALSSISVILVQVGSEEECQTYAVRATLGGGGLWDCNVRLVKSILQLLSCWDCVWVGLPGLEILYVEVHWWGCFNWGGEEAVGGGWLPGQPQELKVLLSGFILWTVSLTCDGYLCLFFRKLVVPDEEYVRLVILVLRKGLIFLIIHIMSVYVVKRNINMLCSEKH